jgi:hypothetical protein
MITSYANNSLFASGGVANMAASKTTKAFPIYKEDRIGVQVICDNTNAVGTLQLQVSNDGSNWDVINIFKALGEAVYTAQPATITVAGSSARNSSDLGAGIHFLIANTALYYRQGGSAVDATSSDHWLPAGREREFVVHGSSDARIAVLQQSAGGTAFITSFPDAYPVASGVDLNFVANLPDLCAAFLRMVYTFTSGDGILDAYIRRQ